MIDAEKLIARLSNASIIPTVHECLSAAALIEQQAAKIAELERILDGLPQDAIDGGWTARGISAYAKQLEEKIGALESASKDAIRREALEEAACCADKHADSYDGDTLPGALPTVRERNACRRVAAAIRALSQKKVGE